LAKIATLPVETVTVDGDLYEVRGLSVRDANRLYGRLVKRGPGGDTEIDRDKWNVAWAIAAVFDPEDGTAVFDDADLDLLMAGRSDIITELARHAARLSGYGGGDEDAAREMKSEPGETGTVRTGGETG
jgi:hypothetical protein